MSTQVLAIQPSVIRWDKWGHPFCKHNRQRSHCKECGGGHICKHDRRRSRCRECGGGHICKHERERSKCRECGGSQVCKHSRLRHSCKECGGFPVLAKEMLRSARTRARKDGLPFNITVEDILELIDDGVCPVLGIQYDLSTRKITDASANLDKFIPSLGYVKGNCAVISRLANRIKTNATTEQFCRVADWMKQRQVQRDEE